MLGRVAAEVAADADELVRCCRSPQRTDDAETVAAELIPLCEALRFLRRRGARILRPRRCGRLGRPLWLWGVTSEVVRVPRGRVLVIGTWNYPLLLPGVQLAQGLAAGNRVLLKPAPGTEAASERLAECFYRGGVPRDALRVLASETAEAIEAIEEGVDLVVLTGSAATGRRVLAQIAGTLTASVMELSGCDAVIALPGADIERLAAAVDFGLHVNSGATCIAPRRLIVDERHAETVIAAVAERLARRDAVTVHPAARGAVAEQVQRALDSGAVDRLGTFDAERLKGDGRMKTLLLDRVAADSEIAAADLFAPVLSVLRVERIEEAIDLVNDCPYRLGASVFGPPHEARSVADGLAVGSVTINDLIVPTADPRLPFGGRGESGFGVTRGEEGLLAMTAVKVVGQRRGRFAPHLSQRNDADAETLIGLMQANHGRGIGRRWSGLRRMIAGVKTSIRSGGPQRQGPGELSDPISPPE